MKKAPLSCWLSPSWRWPAPSSAGGDRRGDIAELSYPINKLTLYTHVIHRGILAPGKKNSGRSKDEKPIVLPLIIALCTLLCGCIMDTYITTPIHSEIVKFIDFINVSHFRHNYISIHFHNKPDHESICALY
jgi:hypothetical protein